jgi:hypothetical protein
MDCSNGDLYLKNDLRKMVINYTKMVFFLFGFHRTIKPYL